MTLGASSSLLKTDMAATSENIRNMNASATVLPLLPSTRYGAPKNNAIPESATQRTDFTTIRTELPSRDEIEAFLAITRKRRTSSTSTVSSVSTTNDDDGRRFGHLMNIQAVDEADEYNQG